MTSRDKIQQKSLAALLTNKGGTIVLSPGTGKSKIAIDYLKKVNAKNILITSPRTNLKDSWEKELQKWCEYAPGHRYIGDTGYSYWFKGIFGDFRVELVNVQTCYKWSPEKLSQFDLIIQDEIHTMVTEEYGNLAIKAKELGITVVGLTGTPDDSKEDKRLFYQQYCPIVYRYLDSAKDGIINKRKYIIYEHELSDKFLVEVVTNTKRRTIGEKKQYDYIQSRVEEGERLIRIELRKPLISEFKKLWKARTSPIINGKLRRIINELRNLAEDTTKYVNYFGNAKAWYWNKSTLDKDKKHAGGVYMRAINNRQNLLWNLTSTRNISMLLAKHIIKKYENSKVLVFSSRTEQAEKISKYCVHSKNSEEVNKDNLDKFNKGIIRQLGSCHSLTLGLNLHNTAFAIMESYNGSDVQFKQRGGRLDRLPVNEDAILIFIVVKNTQGEKWFNNSVKFKEDDIVKTVKSINEFKEVLKELK